MNFLAHAYLSRHSDSLLIGNFIGDFVKGKQFSQYDDQIVKGIMMHRRIDEFTDNHYIFIRSKDRIREKYKHYTGVIIDMFYDHLLANNWSDYSNEALEPFTERIYRVILDQYHILPAEAQNMTHHMVKWNWLLNYSTIEGIDRSLKGMSRRTPFKSGMEIAVNDLQTHYSEFKTDFNEFFPELVLFTELNYST